MALCCHSDDTFSVDKIRHRLEKALWLIDHYTWLVDAYISDFFVNRLSSQVPGNWWYILLAMEPPQMADLLKPKIHQTRTVWPLSLLAFHASVHSVALSNRPVPVDTALCRQLLDHPSTFCSDEKSKQAVVGNGCLGNGWITRQEGKPAMEGTAEMSPCGATLSNDLKRTAVLPVSASALSGMRDGQLLQLDHCYRKHVKPKKQHEITTLAPLLNDLCQTCHCQRVIDVGAGQGHLSRLLSFGYGLTVTTVEAAGCHAPKAAKFDGEVKDELRKERFHCIKKNLYMCDEPSDKHFSQSPRHIIATIDQRDSVDEFLGKLELHHLDLSCDSQCHQQDINTQDIKQCQTNRCTNSQNKTNHRKTKGHGNNHQETNHEETKGHEISHNDTKGHEINHHEIVHNETKGHETNHHEICHNEIIGHETNHHEICHNETKGHETNHHEICHNETKGHETNHHEICHNETKGHETNHHEICHNETKGHETNHHEICHNETKGHKTNHHEICHIETNGHETNHHEICHNETKGHETNHYEISHNETKGHETNRHEISHNETKGHETNCHEIRNHETKGYKTNHHEINRNETKRHETNHQKNNKLYIMRNCSERESCKWTVVNGDIIERTLPAFNPGQHYSSPQRCTTEVTVETGPSGDAREMNDTYDDPDTQEQTLKCDNTFVLTGLHACGNLTPTMMQVFVKCREAAALAVITCCYMKLSSERDRVSCDHVGYPMSTFTRQLANHRLNYEALEGACHFNDAYYRKLTKSSPELVSHAYRAALQEIVMEKCPSMQHGSVKLTMRKAHHMSFKEYAKVGLKRLGLATDVSESQEERAQKKLGRWREVVAFFSLRLCLLPVVETVVLLDRMLFLAQNGISSCLVPIFDPGLSPRNFVLLASKGESLRR